MARIQHIAIFSDDPEKLAEFYSEVYGMQVSGRSKGDVWVTDGYMNAAFRLMATLDVPRRALIGPWVHAWPHHSASRWPWIRQASPSRST